jgi:DNA-binding transcriptional LysR family regulator
MDTLEDYSGNHPAAHDAELRVVAAGLGICVTPKQVALRSASAGEISVVSLTDTWAKRRFAVCFRDPGTLSPAALRMVEFLASKAATEQDAGPRRHGSKRPTTGKDMDASGT